MRGNIGTAGAFAGKYARVTLADAVGWRRWQDSTVAKREEEEVLRCTRH
jgi:hypothetical protein